MNGCDARSAGPATDGGFERIECSGITTRRDFDVTFPRIAHPPGDAEFLTPVADEKPESNPLNLAADSEVDNGHRRGWLASSSEQRGEDRGDCARIGAGGGAWEQENLAATKLLRHEFEHFGGSGA